MHPTLTLNPSRTRLVPDHHWLLHNKVRDAALQGKAERAAGSRLVGWLTQTLRKGL